VTVVNHPDTVLPGRGPVLLDVDPLADNRHTREISAVILSGKLLARDDLDQLLA
jgi:hypothetical protein